MFTLLSWFLCVLISNALSTNSSTNTLDNPRRSMLDNLQHLVDTAFEHETPDDSLWLEQLSRLLEDEEGFRLVDAERRAIYSNDDQRHVFDGSGEMIDEEDLPPIYSNMSVIAFTLGTTTTAFAKYTPRTHPTCPCEKGERGVKGEAGICPADCAARSNKAQKDCLDSRINLERLAQSIRQLILDTKKIAARNAQSTSSCACSVTVPPSSSSSTTVSRLKGDKGDRGETGSACPSSETNVRVFTTLQEAMDASVTYPDHTYVHIVNEQGRLQRVFIRVHGYLVPIRIESENSLVVQVQTIPPTTLAIPKPRCTVALPCPRLHLFAIGPYIRKMCHSKRSNIVCTRLADYDELCGRVAEKHKLKGFYRAFMSSSNQWLSNLFADICVSAKIVNMHEQTVFDSFESIFEQKPPQNEILDIEGLRPQFQYWWHGSFHNGTGSSDTCLDWSRYDSRLSGRASRLPDRVHGIFHHQYTWPCSIGDSNMGMFCIETNCDKRNYYKH